MLKWWALRSVEEASRISLIIWEFLGIISGGRRLPSEYTHLPHYLYKIKLRLDWMGTFSRPSFQFQRLLALSLTSDSTGNRGGGWWWRENAPLLSWTKISFLLYLQLMFEAVAVVKASKKTRFQVRAADRIVTLLTTLWAGEMWEGFTVAWTRPPLTFCTFLKIMSASLAVQGRSLSKLVKCFCVGDFSEKSELLRHSFGSLHVYLYFVVPLNSESPEAMVILFDKYFICLSEMLLLSKSERKKKRDRKIEIGEREREIFHLLVYSSSGCNSQGWARLKPGTWNFRCPT